MRYTLKCARGIIVIIIAIWMIAVELFGAFCCVLIGGTVGKDNVVYKWFHSETIGVYDICRAMIDRERERLHP